MEILLCKVLLLGMKRNKRYKNEAVMDLCACVGVFHDGFFCTFHEIS